MLTDLELLRLELDLLWGESGGPYLVIASALNDGYIRSQYRVADEIRAEVEHSALTTHFSAPPLVVERIRKHLEDALGTGIALARGSGPSFVIEHDLAGRATASVVRSDTADVDGLRHANPGNWGAGEWVDLLEGRLGPWAMAMLGKRVVSTCHTPASNASAAEAGVNTSSRPRTAVKAVAWLPQSVHLTRLC